MKKTILKSVVTTAVVVATMALSSVAAFAADGSTATTTTEGTKTTTVYDFTKGSLSSATAGQKLDCGIYIETAGTQISSNTLLIKNRTVWIPLKEDTKSLNIKLSSNTNTGRFATFGSKYKMEMVNNSSLDIKLLKDEEDCDTKEGQRYLKLSSTDDFKIKALTVTEDSAEVPTFTYSGKIVRDDGSTSAKVFFNGEEITTNGDGSFTISNLPADTYTLTSDDEFVKVEPNSVTITDEDLIDQTINLTKKAVTTLSGAVDENLAKGGSISITGTDYSGTADIANGRYTVTVPQNNTYTVSLDKNSEYIESQYTLDKNTVKVDTTEATLDLTGTKITKWDFKNLPKETIQPDKGKSKIYKGITISQIDTSKDKAKFAIDTDKGQAQFNKNSKATIEIDAATEKLAVTTSANLCKVTYSGNTAIIENIGNDQDFITSIEIIAKDDVVKVDAGAVYTDGADSYIIGAVKNVTEASTKFTVSLGGRSVDTDTVYDSVEIGGTSITAAQVGGDYLYAVKITGADGNLAVNGFTAELS